MLHNYSFVNLPRQAIAPRRLLYISLETASQVKTLVLNNLVKEAFQPDDNLEF
jgi:hypothetical protein